MQHPACGRALLLVAAAASLLPVTVARRGLAAVLQHQHTDLSPVTRVVQLLENLAKKVEEEGKKEEDMYEEFVCWGKTVIGAKEAFNADASARIESMETYLADLKAGRIEITTERADLTKEIEQLNADIELATDMREKAKNDFTEASAEMDQAIKALNAAIEVLGTATKEHKGAFLRMKDSIGENSVAATAEAATLSNAIKLGDKFLTRGDSLFLRRLLAADVPEKDWKKLNRKATFKMSYKARSTKIQDVLAKLLETFESNLSDAKKKESEAAELFEKMMEEKKAQLSAAEEALEKLEKENGARGMSEVETKEELKKLKDQVANDKKYIEQVTATLDEKKLDWKKRKELRVSELAAISKAVSILHGDDARDLFKKSLKSQGYFFLQQGSSSSGSSSKHRALVVDALRKAGIAAHDERLQALAQLAASGPFDEVFAAIDKMMELMKDEEATDLAKMQSCMSDRAVDTRSAIVTSRQLDTMTEALRALASDIEELEKEYKEKEKERKETADELAEATKIRSDENAVYKISKKEDEDAVALIKEATMVLQDFYKENGIALVQSHRQPDLKVEAGMAPPPPPAEWGGYGEKRLEVDSIFTMLSTIQEDIEKDIKKADLAEKSAVESFEEVKASLEKDLKDLKEFLTSIEKTKGQKKEETVTTSEERTAKAGMLQATMNKIKVAEPDCYFFSVNYEVRVRNRHIEMDSLTKAKAILRGADFAMKDPKRELKPGDAF